MRTGRTQSRLGRRRGPQTGGGCPGSHQKEGRPMDSARFDTLAKTLAQAGTRRGLMGGSLGAAVLTALVLSGETLGKKQVTAEHCLAIGEKCPKTLKHGKKKVKHTCEKRCCTRFSAVSPGGKRRCACVPPGQSCTPGTARHCCTQTCGADGRCTGVQAPPPQQTTCTGLDQACTTNAQCCTGICNAGGSTTGPLADTANECATCLSGRATCDPNAQQCCSNSDPGFFGQRSCRDAPGPTGFVCTSVLGEECVADPATPPGEMRRGSCQEEVDRCPTDGTAGESGICCRGSGGFIALTCAPDPINPLCCSGRSRCFSDHDYCCAPSGTNPLESGGAACPAGGGFDEACCSETCNATGQCCAPATTDYQASGGSSCAACCSGTCQTGSICA